MTNNCCWLLIIDVVIDLMIVLCYSYKFAMVSLADAGDKTKMLELNGTDMGGAKLRITHYQPPKGMSHLSTPVTPCCGLCNLVYMQVKSQYTKYGVHHVPLALFPTRMILYVCLFYVKIYLFFYKFKSDS